MPRRPPSLYLESIDEQPEYSLNLGAESPASTPSFDDRIPTPPPRVFARRKSLPRPARRRDTPDRDCGICFEDAVRPSRTLCCGKIFCYEHIKDWLNGPSSDGRCPSCSAPCSSETHILSLSSPTLSSRPPSRHKLVSPDQEGSMRMRSQSTSTSTSKESRTSDSSQTSSDCTADSSVLGLTPTPEESDQHDSDVSEPWIAYALGFAHTHRTQPRTTHPSPYPFIHPGSSTLEVLGRLTSVMGLTLLFYVLLAS